MNRVAAFVLRRSRLAAVPLAIALCCGSGQAAAQTSDAGTLAKIKETGLITLGYRESSVPFSYIDDQQHAVGFSIELCNQIVAQLKVRYKLDTLKTVYQPVTAANRIPLLQNGTIDMECGSTTNTTERQKAVSFLLTTFVTGTKLMVRANSPVADVRDLKGQSIVLTSGTNNIKAIQSADQRDGLGLKMLFGKDHAESMLLLDEERAAAFSTDEILLYSLRANARDPRRFKVVGPLLSEEPYAIMVRKDDPAFKKAADDVLRAMFRDGSFAKTYDKWFLMPIAPKGISLNLPMSDRVKEVVANPTDTGS